MSDLQLRDFVDAIWNKAAELPAEPEGVVAFHDGVDFLLEVRGKCFAVELIHSPLMFGLPAVYFLKGTYIPDSVSPAQK